MGIQLEDHRFVMRHEASTSKPPLNAERRIDLLAPKNVQEAICRVDLHIIFHYKHVDQPFLYCSCCCSGNRDESQTRLNVRLTASVGKMIRTLVYIAPHLEMRVSRYPRANQ